MKRFILIIFLLMFMLTSCVDSDEDESTNDNTTAEKPVIYLYPKEKIEVSVELNYEGQFLCTYPEYNNGWKVTASPDGRITNNSDNQEYSYLFWEGIDHYDWNIKTGFVVQGSETEAFLREKLEYMGLIPKEYNEFIVYWLPRMQSNPYNLIHFAGEEYNDLAKLTINPKPDSILRVFMVFESLDEPIEIEEQDLSTFDRVGFAVIEWGGTRIK